MNISDDFKKNMVGYAQAKEKMISLHQDVVKEKAKFWSYFKNDLQTGFNLKFVYGTSSPKEILEVYREYWNCCWHIINRYYDNLRNIINNCSHDLVIFDENISCGLCPVCNKYLKLEDIPLSELIYLPDINLDEMTIEKIRQIIIEAFNLKANLTKEELKNIIMEEFKQNNSLMRQK